MNELRALVLQHGVGFVFLNVLIEAPLIVDVRSDQARKRDPRRIPGAIAVNLLDLDEKIGQLPTDREIVLYCT